METIELKNACGSLIYNDGQVFLRNAATGGALFLSGGEEFVLYIEKDEKIETRSALLFDFCGKKLSTDGKKLELDYEKDGLFVKVFYETKERTFEKRIEVRSNVSFNLKRVSLENRRSNLPLSRGGEGQFVFAGDEVWCGMEFPVAVNRFEGDVLSFVQTPFEKTRLFNSLSVVYGFNDCGDIVRSFERYIESKALNGKKREPLRIYCDWGLHDDLSDDVILTQEMTLDNIKRLKDLRKRSGVRFDYYLMDAFWFENGKPYIDFKGKTFPDGVQPVLDALKDADMKYGLWFDINCIHAHLNELGEYKKYDTLLENGSLCFACDKIAKLMTDAIKYHIVNHGIKMIKLDFAYFECKNSKHGHSVEYTESKEKSVKNFLRMVKELKRVEPELKILCYNGWTTNLSVIGSVEERTDYAISPFWCEYVDYLYCGDPRPSEIACEKLEDSVLYYTDAMVREFRASSMPFYAIDDHGTMMGHTSTIYKMGKKLFRNGILMDVMRGGGKLNLYGDVAELDEEDLKYLSLVDGVYEDIVRREYGTQFILGDARKGEIYGYATDGVLEGYAVVVNPVSQKRMRTLSLPQWKGVNVTVQTLIRDGELIHEKESEIYSELGIELSANGCTFIKWKVQPQEKRFDKVFLCKGEKLLLNTCGKRLLYLTFTKDEKPLRTGTGYPEGLWVNRIVNGVSYPAEKTAETSCESFIWSGVSWLTLSLNGAESAEIIYSGEEPVMLKYSMSEDKK